MTQSFCKVLGYYKILTMRILFLLLFVLLNKIANCQLPALSENDNIQFTEKGEEKEGNRHGTWNFTHTEAGQNLLIRTEYKNGKLDGKVKITLNDKIILNGFFRDGLMDSTWQWFDLNTFQVILKAAFKNKPPIKYFFSSSKTLIPTEFLKINGHILTLNDSIDGATDLWILTDIKFGEKEIIYFKNGKFDGKYQRFYENSALKSECIFLNGKINGIYKQYHSDGKLQYQETYVNGITEGKWSYYGENGTVWEEGNRVNGIEVGPTKKFYTTGELFKEGILRKGTTIWDMKTFDKNKNLICTGVDDLESKKEKNKLGVLYDINNQFIINKSNLSSNIIKNSVTFLPCYSTQLFYYYGVLSNNASNFKYGNWKDNSLLNDLGVSTLLNGNLIFIAITSSTDYNIFSNCLKYLIEMGAKNIKFYEASEFEEELIRLTLKANGVK
jgi:antitoxin component YwqK of YwqJK toxin-antitoxin module